MKPRLRCKPQQQQIPKKRDISICTKKTSYGIIASNNTGSDLEKTIKRAMDTLKPRSPTLTNTPLRKDTQRKTLLKKAQQNFNMYSTIQGIVFQKIGFWGSGGSFEFRVSSFTITTRPSSLVTHHSLLVLPTFSPIANRVPLAKSAPDWRRLPGS